MTSTEKVFEFTRAVREFHYFQNIWQPKEAEPNCFHEPDNAFDAYAIKTVTNNGVTVWHLPRAISRVTKFLLDHGAKISLILSSTCHR